MAATRIVLGAAALALTTGGLAYAQGGQPGPQGQPAPPAQPPPPTPKLVVGKPQSGVAVREGQDGRYRLAGTWYFRQDDTNLGLSQRWFDQDSLSGWGRIDVPHNWNAADYIENRSSVGWYRKEFKLPRKLCVKPLTREEKREQRMKKRKRPKGPQTCDRFRWRVRFLGATHRAIAYLNGKVIATHTGGYFPFEAALDGLKEGRNTLVVRVSSLRGNTDLTHWRAASFNGYGTGGWWNFGGLNREVYVRRIDGVDVESLQVFPRLPRLKGPARVETRMRVRWLGAERERVNLSLLVTAGKRRREIELPSRVFEPGGERTIGASFTIDRPHLWQPRKGFLYGIAAIAEGEKSDTRSVYRAGFGVRKIEVRPGGVVRLNGKQMRARGASIHEDHPRVGAAWGPAQRNEAVRRLRQLGATVTRAHYPLHPAMLEMLDRAGILVWSQAPVYQWPNTYLDNPRLRAAAVNANRLAVENNINHPSIFAWSIANELGSEPSEVGTIGPGYAAFVDAAAQAVRAIDNTRLVAIDRHSRLGESPYNASLARLDALGINEYFGWYNASAPGAPPSTTADLPTYLDQLHALYPNMPLFITEYGAESSREGPETEKGTFPFQTKWLYDHTLIHGARSFVNASMIWALKDFRVHPTWGGGDPQPTPPWNNKGLIHETGTPKSAFWIMRKLFRDTNQFR